MGAVLVSPLDSAAVMERFVMLLAKGVKDNYFNSFFGKYYSSHTRPYKETLALVNKLKKKYKLGVLSNTIRVCVTVNKKRGIFKDFDVLIFSCEVKCLKPQRKIYQIAAKRMKLPPKNLLFIDDKLENVRAARKLGMKAIHFKSFQQLKSHLKKLNII